MDLFLKKFPLNYWLTYVFHLLACAFDGIFSFFLSKLFLFIISVLWTTD